MENCGMSLLSPSGDSIAAYSSSSDSIFASTSGGRITDGIGLLGGLLVFFTLALSNLFVGLRFSGLEFRARAASAALGATDVWGVWAWLEAVISAVCDSEFDPSELSSFSVPIRACGGSSSVFELYLPGRSSGRCRGRGDAGVISSISTIISGASCACEEGCLCKFPNKGIDGPAAEGVGPCSVSSVGISGSFWTTMADGAGNLWGDTARLVNSCGCSGIAEGTSEGRFAGDMWGTWPRLPSNSFAKKISPVGNNMFGCGNDWNGTDRGRPEGNCWRSAPRLLLCSGRESGAGLISSSSSNLSSIARSAGEIFSSRVLRVPSKFPNWLGSVKRRFSSTCICCPVRSLFGISEWVDSYSPEIP